MKPQRKLIVLALGLGITVLFSGLGNAQQRPRNTWDVRLQGSEQGTRQFGGSCMWDAKGELINQPEGKQCELKKPRGIQSHHDGELQEELKQILREHHHLHRELAGLQQLVDASGSKEASDLIRKIQAESDDHRTRMKRTLEKITGGPAKQR